MAKLVKQSAFLHFLVYLRCMLQERLKKNWNIFVFAWMHIYVCTYEGTCAFKNQPEAIEAIVLLLSLSYTIPCFDCNLVKLKPFVNVIFL